MNYKSFNKLYALGILIVIFMFSGYYKGGVFFLNKSTYGIIVNSAQSEKKFFTISYCFVVDKNRHTGSAIYKEKHDPEALLFLVKYNSMCKSINKIYLNKPITSYDIAMDEKLELIDLCK